ncbi:MAG TPA: hypothetical protein VMY76_00450 [Gemmatimonadales bacterium]|nr:hypothetical protein [Gemmatimonadales bacterium]
MNARGGLIFAGLVALAACTGERGEGREVAITDSLTRELEIAPADTATPIATEHRTEVGGRAGTARVSSSATPSPRPRAKPPARERRPAAGTHVTTDSASTRDDSPANVDRGGLAVDSGAEVAVGSMDDSAEGRIARAVDRTSDASPADAKPAPASRPTSTPTPPPAPAPAERTRIDTAADAAQPAGPGAPTDTSAPAAPAPSSVPAGDTAAAPPASRSAPAADMHVLAAGTHLRALLEDSIHSLRNSAGQTVTALVSGDMRAPDGRTLVPSGSAVRLSITRLKPARTRSAADGELELRADSVIVSGRAYPLRAEVQPVPHELKGRGVTAGEAEKVAAGAAIGAVAGGVITGKTKGAVIGGAVGAAGGAVVAAQTASRDVVVTPRTLIVLTLTAPFALDATGVAAP